MTDLSSVMRWLGFGLAIAAACDRDEAPAPSGETPPPVAPIAKSEPVAPKTPQIPIVDAPAAAAPMPEVAPAVAAVVPPAPPPTTGGSWRVLHTSNTSARLEANVGGLVRFGSEIHEQGPKGELREVRGLTKGFGKIPNVDIATAGEGTDEDLEIDDQGIEGRWPENAWHVMHLSDGRRGDMLVLRHWDGQRWRTPKIEIPPSTAPDPDGIGPLLVASKNVVSSLGVMMVRGYSDRGGFMLAGIDVNDHVTAQPIRVDSNAPIPLDLPEDWQLLEWTETRSAGLFSYSWHDDAGKMRRTCPLPKTETCTGSTFDLPQMADDAGSFVIVPAGDDRIIANNDKMVIQFRDDEWRWDAPPDKHTIASITADERGGAWAILHNKYVRSLWYLSPDGTWTERTDRPALTDDQSVSVRMVAGPRLWLLASADKASTLHELTPPNPTTP